MLGDGATAAAGQSVTVHYTGWLTSGRKIDSSKDRNDPFVFNLVFEVGLLADPVPPVRREIEVIARLWQSRRRLVLKL